MSPSHLHSWFLGVGYSHAYEVFNYFECAAWIVIAAVLHLRFRKHPADQRAVARTCIAPVVIGRSDYFEAPTPGASALVAVGLENPLRRTPSLPGTARRPARFRRGAVKSDFLARLLQNPGRKRARCLHSSAR